MRPLQWHVWVLCAILAGGLSAADGASTVRLMPSPGRYAVVVPVVPLARLSAGERLVYTVDGSPASATAWPVSGPILLTDTATVRVGIIAADGALRLEAQGAYVIAGPLTTARPVPAPAGGSYVGEQQVVLSSSTPGSVIRYTVDGREPTESSQRYTAPVRIASDTALRARAFGGRVTVRLGCLTIGLPAVFPSGVMTARYVITGQQQQQVATPICAPAAGTYRTDLTVTAATATAGAVLHYRLDATDPTAADPVFPASGLTVAQSQVIAVRAYRDGWTPSAVMRADYRLQVPDPGIVPASGLSHDPLTVTVAVPTGAVVRYTTDGTDPTAESPTITGPVLVDRSLQLRAQAVRPGWDPSAIVAAAWTLQPLPPTASLASGTYIGTQTVTLSSATPDAVVHYTVDGATPTGDSPVATGPIQLPGSCTLQAVAMRSGWLTSSAMTVAYTLQVPTPTVDVAAGTFTAPVQVTASDTLDGAVLRYTLDGSVPTDASPVAGGPVPIDQPVTLTVLASRAGWEDASLVTVAYGFQVATPVFAGAPGAVTGSVAVAASTTTPGATLRYTLDSTAPSTASPELPVTLTQSATLTVAGFRAGWQSSASISGLWTVTPTIGFASASQTVSEADGSVVLTVQLSAATDHDVTIDYAAQDGTAVNGTDFSLLSGTLTIPQGQTAGQITMTLLNQQRTGEDRTCDITLSASSGAALSGVASVTVTIQATGTAGPLPTFTERRSPLWRQPKELLDVQRWLVEDSYKAAYLAAKVPERIWESNEPTKVSSGLRVVGTAFRSANVGSLVVVTLAGAPGMPVTWLVDRLEVAKTSLDSLNSTTFFQRDGLATISLDVVGVGQAHMLVRSPSSVGFVCITIQGVKP